MTAAAFDLAAALAAALGAPRSPDAQLAVAVSGGPDSLALLRLAAVAFPGRVAALTVDHALRPDSAAEAAGVAARCAGIGVPHTTLVWTGPKPRGNLQAAARGARYALMGDWCAANGVGVLLTAHHRDDQAETLLLRLARGSGSGGLAGVRPVRHLQPGVAVVRPLLGVPRADLVAVVAAAGWDAVDDPANHDRRHDRTAARAVLAATPWLSPARLAAAAAHLGDAEAALAWAADRAWAGGAVVTAAGVDLDVAGLPDELVRRLVVRALAMLAPDAQPDGGRVAALVGRLAAGQAATLAGVAARGGAIWRFRRADSRRKTRQTVG
jgi:tRNA(Ile)-lysidine synthase